MNTNDIGYLIKIIDERLKTRADSDLKEHNLTMSQSIVLTFLCSKENYQATQKEIELHLQVSHPAVVGIISRMEQNGHLNTWMDPDNRRNKMVRLTPHAVELGQTMDGLRSHWEDTMLSGLSSEEIDTLKKLLFSVSRNLL